jgi:hypothetical protein
MKLVPESKPVARKEVREVQPGAGPVLLSNIGRNTLAKRLERPELSSILDVNGRMACFLSKRQRSVRE